MQSVVLSPGPVSERDVLDVARHGAPVELSRDSLAAIATSRDVVERLADEKGLSKTALVRQALRLYQSISSRLDNGEKVFVEHPTTKEKAELMVLS